MRDLFENDSKTLARDDARAALRNIVRRIGGKVAAAATGLGETHISTALSDDPKDRYLRDEHIDALLRLATPAEIDAYWCARIRACADPAAHRRGETGEARGAHHAAVRRERRRDRRRREEPAMKPAPTFNLREYLRAAERRLALEVPVLVAAVERHREAARKESR